MCNVIMMYTVNSLQYVDDGLSLWLEVGFDQCNWLIYYLDG